MEEKEKIINFIYLTDHWIQIILEERIFKFLLPRRRASLSIAHEAYKSVRHGLESVVKDIEHYNDNEFFYNINRYGLVGVEWDFKYSVVMQHANAVERKLKDIQFTNYNRASDDAYGQRRTLRKYIKRLLKSIDSILDSIIGSGIQLHPIKEFKDTLMSMLD